jgi:hypothetical protein
MRADAQVAGFHLRQPARDAEAKSMSMKSGVTRANSSRKFLDRQQQCGLRLASNLMIGPETKK